MIPTGQRTEQPAEIITGHWPRQARRHIVMVPTLSDATSDTFYAGPDRRRHRVYVTRNTEYHCRDGICLAVRSRRTGSFQLEHAAIGKRVTAGVTFAEGEATEICEPGDVHTGHQLCFSSVDGRFEDHDDVLTSVLHAVERPPKEIVARYASFGR